MSNERRAILSSLVLAVLVTLGTCGPAPETVVVQETDVVAGAVVDVQKAEIATAGPEPTTAPDPAPTDSPEPERKEL
jgi:hypothetical protein